MESEAIYYTLALNLARLKKTSLREIYQIILNKPTESDFISIIVLLDLRLGPCRGHFLYGLLESTTKFHLCL